MFLIIWVHKRTVSPFINNKLLSGSLSFIAVEVINSCKFLWEKFKQIPSVKNIDSGIVSIDITNMFGFHMIYSIYMSSDMFAHF